MTPPNETPSEHVQTHGTLRHVRKRRKRTRKLSDNREVMASVIVMTACGLLLLLCFIYIMSTRSCQLPAYFRNGN